MDDFDKTLIKNGIIKENNYIKRNIYCDICNNPVKEYIIVPTFCMQRMCLNCFKSFLLNKEKKTNEKTRN